MYEGSSQCSALVDWFTQQVPRALVAASVATATRVGHPRPQCSTAQRSTAPSPPQPAVQSRTQLRLHYRPEMHGTPADWIMDLLTTPCLTSGPLISRGLVSLVEQQPEDHLHSGGSASGVQGSSSGSSNRFGGGGEDAGKLGRGASGGIGKVGEEEGEEEEEEVGEESGRRKGTCIDASAVGGGDAWVEAAADAFAVHFLEARQQQEQQKQQQTQRVQQQQQQEEEESGRGAQPQWQQEEVETGEQQAPGLNVWGLWWQQQKEGLAVWGKHYR